MPAAPEIHRAIRDGNLDRAFALARVYAQAEVPSIITELTVIEGNYNFNKSEHGKGKITNDEYLIHRARASDWLGQKFVSAAGAAPMLNHGYHALTCNREEQTTRFEQLFNQRYETGERVQFYYLYGGRYQSHESLSKRLVHERSGMERGRVLTATTKIGEGSVLVDVCEDVEFSKVEFIKRLCEAFSINPDGYADLKSKRLDFILQESSVLNGLRTTDFAFCFIEVSTWDNQLVPIVGEWFVKEFCNCTLHVDAPTCLFFFGVNYSETDERTPREIEVALRNAEHTVGLPELTMIQEANLADWIQHYSRALGLTKFSARDELLHDLLTKIRAKQQKLLSKQVPGKEHLLHMEDVETVLEQYIDEKNE